MADYTAYTSTATLGDIMLRVYDRGSIQNVQNLTSDLLSQLGQAQDFKVGGDGFYFGVDVLGDEEFQYGGEDMAIPTPKTEVVKQARVRPVVLIGQVSFTGLGRAVSQQDEHAFLSAIQYATDRKLQRMFAYKEGAIFRDGTGRLGDVNGAVSGAGPFTASVDGPGVQWLRPNMTVDVIVNGSNHRIGAIISDVDWAANQIVYDGGAVTGTPDVDNAMIFRTTLQTPATPTAVVEITGLPAAIAASGTYLNINRATYPTWEGNVVDAAGGPLSEDLLLRMENRLKVVGGLSRGEIMGCALIIHPNQCRKYFELVSPQKEYTGMSLDAGYKKLSWNGRPIIDCYNVPETEAYMGMLSALQEFVAPGGEMQIDTVFGPAIKWTPGYDKGVMYMREYDNYAVRQPNAWVRSHTLENVATR